MLNFSKRGMDDGRKLVGQLQDIFSIPERRPDKSAERDAWRQAQVVVSAKLTALNEVARRLPQQSDSPEWIDAKSALEKAQADCNAKQQAHAVAAERRDQEFAAEVREKFAQAAPTLTALAQLIADAMEPLVQMHMYAIQHGLTVPAQLQATPRLACVTREIANQAAALRTEGTYK
jgi:hypothetical protein